MVLSFEVAKMRSDCRVFATLAQRFFDDGGARIVDLERKLENVTREATVKADRTFHWTTRIKNRHEPLRTRPSKDYRNEARADDALHAELSFDLSGHVDAAGAIAIVSKGGTRVGFFRGGEPHAAKNIHFDIHGGDGGSAAGHPPIHFQSEEGLKELPRLSTSLIHPLDIAEFILMELFQQKWRDHRLNSGVRSRSARFASVQRLRLAHKFVWMTERAREEVPLLALLQQPGQPFQLHPTF